MTGVTTSMQWKGRLPRPDWRYPHDYLLLITKEKLFKESFGTRDLQIANSVSVSFPKSSTVGHVAFGGGTKLNIIVKSYHVSSEIIKWFFHRENSAIWCYVPVTRTQSINSLLSTTLQFYLNIDMIQRYLWIVVLLNFMKYSLYWSNCKI